MLVSLDTNPSINAYDNSEICLKMVDKSEINDVLMDNISNRIYYELDPAGDVTLLVVNVPQDLPPNLNELKLDVLAGRWPPANTSDSSQGSEQNPLYIRASSKHLALACGYFHRMFGSGFSEGMELQSKGFVELKINHPNGLAFLLLMLIVHCQPRLVSRKLSKQTLTDVAVLVDYYQCHAAVDVFADMWIKAIEKEKVYELKGGESLKWVMISWVFRYEPKFKEATKEVVGRWKNTINARGLPIPTVVLDMMNTQRTSFLQAFINSLHQLHTQVYRGCLLGARSNTNKNELCTYVVLGAYTKAMMDKNVLMPKTQAPFEGIQVSRLIKDLRKSMASPRIDDKGTHDKCGLFARGTAMLRLHRLPEGFDFAAVRI
ncbi:hypothetical protein ASPCAL13972 [Aspergillus calidoustus]|uniref:BTB domain-containing protein n=1 Tax=Aspergillus calidoustus TaxID=454130 RepID=A0A0U5GGN7_ASPCI|nr:hypothetical protein ASPCAL13972 [Aspergillus calidoustus]